MRSDASAGIYRAVSEGAENPQRPVSGGRDNASTTSRVADNLVKNGYLARTRDIKSDQRQVKFILTLEGYHLRDKLSSYRKELLESILDSIPKAKLPQVIEALELLNEAIDFTVLLSRSDQKHKNKESHAAANHSETIS